jgi:16S rRNA (adenine1518-N6/adenine1519-N6)-dimethyltransferase
MTDRLPKPKRSFGQNFLIDKNYVRKIINAARLTESKTVVEIGPGHGALTEELVKLSGEVIAIELDRELAAILKNQFEAIENFRLLQADALDVDFERLASESGSRLTLVANLPYNISTAILTHLISYRHSFTELILMFQREVADRISAGPATSDRGYLTVTAEAFMIVERLFDVPPTAFKPVPKVWSSVVRLIPRDDTEFDTDTGLFQSLVSNAFRQKRKTLLNNLKQSAAALHISDAGKLLEAANIDPSRRAETLRIEEWERLFVRLRG